MKKASTTPTPTCGLISIYGWADTESRVHRDSSRNTTFKYKGTPKAHTSHTHRSTPTSRSLSSHKNPCSLCPSRNSMNLTCRLATNNHPLRPNAKGLSISLRKSEQWTPRYKHSAQMPRIRRRQVADSLRWMRIAFRCSPKTSQKSQLIRWE